MRGSPRRSPPGQGLPQRSAHEKTAAQTLQQAPTKERTVTRMTTVIDQLLRETTRGHKRHTIWRVEEQSSHTNAAKQTKNQEGTDFTRKTKGR